MPTRRVVMQHPQGRKRRRRAIAISDTGKRYYATDRDDIDLVALKRRLTPNLGAIAAAPMRAAAASAFAPFAAVVERERLRRAKQA